MSFGETLRAAREAKGLTTSQLAAATHILVQVIDGLEQENFKRIPAAIYGRGFVKLYCEEVGLDPKPLQAEFLDLYTKHKNAPEKVSTPGIPARNPSKVVTPEDKSEKPVAVAPQQAPEPMPEVKASASVADMNDTLFSSPVTNVENAGGDIRDTTHQMETRPPVAQPQPRRSYGDLFAPAYSDGEKEEKISAADRFRSTMSNVSSGVFANVKKLPPNTGRIAAVVAGAVIVVAFLSWGISILYKATTPQTHDDATAETVATSSAKPTTSTATKNKDADKAPSKKPSKNTDTAKTTPKTVKPGELKSSGVTVPPLYVD